MCRLSWNLGSLNLLEPSGPLQACNGIALPLPLTFTKMILLDVCSLFNDAVINTDHTCSVEWLVMVVCVEGSGHIMSYVWSHWGRQRNTSFVFFCVLAEVWIEDLPKFYFHLQIVLNFRNLQPALVQLKTSRILFSSPNCPQFSSLTACPGPIDILFSSWSFILRNAIQILLFYLHVLTIIVIGARMNIVTLIIALDYYWIYESTF